MKHKLKTVLMTVTIILLISIFAIRITVYSPYRDYEATSYTYDNLRQILSPDVYNFSLGKVNPTRFSIFTSVQDLNFSVWNIPNTENFYGQFKYDLKGSSVTSSDSYKFGENVKSQDFYLNQKAVETKNLEKGHYNYYVRLKTPTELTEFLGELHSIHEHTKFGEKGLLWTALQTSDDKDATTIGINGCLRMGSHPSEDEMCRIMEEYAEGNFEQFINNFKEILTAFSRADYHVDTALSSGFYGNNVSIDFKDRLDYVTYNGYKAIGAVIFANEDFINDKIMENMEIIKIDKLP